MLLPEIIQSLPEALKLTFRYMIRCGLANYLSEYVAICLRRFGQFLKSG